MALRHLMQKEILGYFRCYFYLLKLDLVYDSHQLIEYLAGFYSRFSPLLYQMIGFQFLQRVHLDYLSVGRQCAGFPQHG